MPQGMLIAAGTGIKSGNIDGGHTLDLAPTILTMLDQPVPTEMEGKVLPIFKD
jgi:bisphosphoglycerate-independent phosphoglycerate mutase (AlkP superfamily)